MCKPAKPRRGTVKVTCTVKVAAPARTRAARASLTRGGTVYARGSRRSPGPVALRATRTLGPGRYTLRLSITDSAGRRTLTTSAVTLA